METLGHSPGTAAWHWMSCASEPAATSPPDPVELASFGLERPASGLPKF